MNPVPWCVDLKHKFRCPHHPEAYCLDKEGKTCVLCKDAEKRFKRSQLKKQRVAREAQVAAALAARADTLTAGKVRWHTKLPVIDRLAKTEPKISPAGIKINESSSQGKQQSGEDLQGCQRSKAGEVCGDTKFQRRRDLKH